MKEHMDEFWKPVADPSPDVLARQLTVLRYWLSRPAWTPNQAACLLAGVCPIDDFVTDIAFAAYLPVAEVDAYLPGRQEWEHSSEIGKKITEGRIAQIETSLVQSFSREHVTPKDFIGLGIRFGFKPPWLEYALNDAACIELLPDDLKGVAVEGGGKNEAQQKKANKRWENDDRRVLLNGRGREEFDKIRHENFRGHTRKSGQVIFASLARAIGEAIKNAAPDEPSCWPDPKTITRQVKVWLNDQQADDAGALSENTRADQT